jgi:hypothetical protein
MTEPKSQSRTIGGVLLGLLVGWLAVGSAAAQEVDVATRAAPSLFRAATPLGAVEYQAGRGLRVGDTGLTLGGFVTAEAERLEDDTSRGGLEGASLFVFYDPVSFVHAFSELDFGNLAEWDDEHRGLRSNPDVEVDRLYADVGRSDALQLRVGKFLTPFGRWNLAPAEPLVWTTSEPLIVEEVFDEVVTGAMAFGSVFPGGEALSYSAYGTFLDPIAPDPEAPPAERSAGAHLEWASLRGLTIGASYFASAPDEDDRHHLGGFDALWASERIELSGEALFGEGTRESGALWGLYAQAAVETVRTLWAVGRYEHFDPPGAERAVDLFDLGFAWIPAHWARLKGDYLFADHRGELAEPGFRASLSFLF